MQNQTLRKQSGLQKQNCENCRTQTFMRFLVFRSQIDQAGALADWVDQFYKIVSKKTKIGALYFEMNGFSINTNQWHIDGFSYSKDGGLHLEDEDDEDMEWLCDWDCETQDFEGHMEPDTVFVIKNLEKLQIAYAQVRKAAQKNEQWVKKVEDAEDWCEHIITALFMELMRSAHVAAKRKKYAWAKIPIFLLCMIMNLL